MKRTSALIPFFEPSQTHTLSLGCSLPLLEKKDQQRSKKRNEMHEIEKRASKRKKKKKAEKKS
jgi:hypothetical protein